MESKLYLVPTPIGNLGDITLRALEVLKSVDGILAEDTRKTGQLLKHYQIEQKMQSYHAHNEHGKLSYILEQLEEGKSFALVTDAGTPAISDPGFLLVRACLEEEIAVEALPGATAFVPALVKSGLPTERFIFWGFLPHKKGRQTQLQELASLRYTFVLYESPHRLEKTLRQLAEVLGNERKASVSRELTKLHEETRNGTLEELLAAFSGTKVKGELVIVVAGETEKKKSEEVNN